MGDTKDYIVKDASSNLSGRFKDVQVIAEGDHVGIFPENYDLCKKTLPMIEEFDEKARYLLPSYFMIPVSVLEAWVDPSCWTLDYILFGRIWPIAGAKGKGFVLSYFYDPPSDAASVHECFKVEVRFRGNGYPVGFEFGPIF